MCCQLAAGGKTVSRIRVIVVDDEPERVEFMCKGLLPEQWEVQKYASAAAFVSILETGGAERPDVIVLDIMMPPPTTWNPKLSEFGTRTGMVLFELARCTWDDVPVFFLTNLRDSTVNETIAAAGRARIRRKRFVLNLATELQDFLASLSPTEA